jgi:hypothetical protein
MRFIDEGRRLPKRCLRVRDLPFVSLGEGNLITSAGERTINRRTLTDLAGNL